jgi:hypothetical protein
MENENVSVITDESNQTIIPYNGDEIYSQEN